MSRLVLEAGYEGGRGGGVLKITLRDTYIRGKYLTIY